MKLRSLKDNIRAVANLEIILTIGMVFAGLMILAYVIFTIEDSLNATGDAANTLANITGGFDDAINLILIAITIFVLALMIAALYLIKGRKQ